MRTSRQRVLVTLLAAVTACAAPPPESPEPETGTGTMVARSGGGAVELPLRDRAAMRELQGLGLMPVPTLTLLRPTPDEVIEPGSLTVSYRIDGYTVSEDSGQHVHVIVDDQAYMADYSPEGSVTIAADQLARGTHTLTAFLSRPMHLALKNPEAAARVRFHVGEPGVDAASLDLTAPTLVYSRPKGQYARSDGSAQNIMLDFYLFHAVLGEGQYAVRVTVDGGTPSLLDAWWPSIVLTDPAPGEHSVRLELLDAAGNPVPGPSNDVTRTIVVVE